MPGVSDMYFPPGDPVEGEDPKRLLEEFWRADDRNRGAPYAERYVSFSALVERARALDDAGWTAFLRLYARDHTRRKLTPGTELDWVDRARSARTRR
jgi:hypothetical protein